MAASARCDTERKGYLIVAGNGRARKYNHIAKKLNLHKKVLFLGQIQHIQNALSC